MHTIPGEEYLKAAYHKVTINVGEGIDTDKVLFDTGALHANYISSTFVDTHDHNSCFICTHQYNNTSHIQYMLSCCHNSVCHNCYIKLDNNSVFMKTCVFCRNAFDGNIFCPCTGVICKCNR